MTNILSSTNTKKYSHNHRLESIDNLSSQTESNTDKHRKKSIHQPRKKTASRKGYSELSEQLFGKIRSTKPLQCQGCGSREIKLRPGKGGHKIQAYCQNQNCNHSWPVKGFLADSLMHLVEPDPPPRKHPCRRCGNLAEAVDQLYCQCWQCDGLLTLMGGEV